MFDRDQAKVGKVAIRLWPAASAGRTFTSAKETSPSQSFLSFQGMRLSEP